MRKTELVEAADRDVRTLSDAEIDDVGGGFLPLLCIAAFGTGFFAGYGAVRFAQDVSD